MTISKTETAPGPSGTWQCQNCGRPHASVKYRTKNGCTECDPGRGATADATLGLVDTKIAIVLSRIMVLVSVLIGIWGFVLLVLVQVRAGVSLILSAIGGVALFLGVIAMLRLMRAVESRTRV